MSQRRTFKGYRIYEGEWVFSCINSSCLNGTVIEYSLNDYEDYADYFMDSRGIHTTNLCEKCNSPLEWLGYSGGAPISDSLASLIKNGHYMASTVILSAIIENVISDLLWASLADSGVSQEKANKIADSRLGRIDSINIIRELTDIDIKDISFPSRNLVAHGKGFSNSEGHYKKELLLQFKKIDEWVKRMLKNRKVESFNPSEIDRWLMFIRHWSTWLNTYLKPVLTSEEAPSTTSI